MRRACLAVLLGLLALTGCARHYVLRLTNGAEVTAATKPRLLDGSWYYKDATGEEQFMPVARVREIAPASAAASDNKPQGVKGGPPKKRHWYFLWLA